MHISLHVYVFPFTTFPYFSVSEESKLSSNSRTSSPAPLTAAAKPIVPKSEVVEGGPVAMVEQNGTATGDETSLPVAPTVPKQEDKGHPERKRRASNESMDVSTLRINESPFLPSPYRVSTLAGHMNTVKFQLTKLFVTSFVFCLF